jgi:hypothetical protein
MTRRVARLAAWGERHRLFPASASLKRHSTRTIKPNAIQIVPSNATKPSSRTVSYPATSDTACRPRETLAAPYRMAAGNRGIR